MSRRQLHEHIGHQQPKWADPEESCGEFVTKVSEEESVWLAKGPAAEVWTTLSPEIRDLIESEDYRCQGVSVFFYMAGKEKAEASPRIIFCSSDEAARRKIRKAVRQSSILEPYPQIKLGDSSSPLARSDSGLNRVGPPPPGPRARPARTRDFQDRRRRRPTRPSIQGAGSLSTLPHPGGQSSNNNPKLRLRNIPRDRDSELHTVFNKKISITDPYSPESCDNSTFSKRSCGSTLSRVSAPSSTSSVFVDDAENSLSDTTTVKGGILATSHTSYGHVRNSTSSSDDDDESFSETESTPELTPLGSHPTILQERNGLVRKLLEAFYSRQQLPQSASTQDTFQISYCGHDVPAGTSVSSGPNKRPGEDLEKGTQDLGDTSAPRVGTKRSKIPCLAEKMFACPYWKKDRWTFSECSRWELRKVNNVKQHLRRRHTKKIRCSKCQATFKSETDRDNHVRFTSCPRREVVEDNGISGDQMKELNKRGPSQTQEQRWYALWDIVFPQTTQPRSPYLELDLSEELEDFREFSRIHGANMILDYMRTVSGWTLDDERRFGPQHLTDIFDRALEAIHRRWESQRPPLYDHPSGNPVPISATSQPALSPPSNPHPRNQEQIDEVGSPAEFEYENVLGSDLNHSDHPSAAVDPRGDFAWLDDPLNDTGDLPTLDFDIVPWPKDNEET